MTKTGILSTGFVALDVIRSATEPHLRLAVGGSCGNVSTTLAALGYNVTLQAHLGLDAEGQFVLANLKLAGVNTSAIRLDASRRTPVVIHEILSGDNRGVDHRFILTAPRSGHRLPRFGPIEITDAHRTIRQGKIPRVFYFDRISPAIVELAKWAKHHGAITFFEPSDIQSDIVITEVEPFVDILKVSAERVHELANRMNFTSPVRILTAGRDGLAVHFGQSAAHRLAAVPVSSLIDSAGAGDAVSSMLITAIVNHRSEQIPPEAILLAGLRRGQRLAALNCAFRGARGAIENLGPEGVLQFIDRSEMSALQTSTCPSLKCGQPPSRSPRDWELERLYG